MTVDLDELLIAAATDPQNTDKTRVFAEALVESPVIMLEFPPMPDNPRPLLILNDETGPVMPIFTSVVNAEHALEHLKEGAEGELDLHPATYSAREIMTAAVRNQTRTALNVFSQYGKVFMVPEMSALLYGGPGEIKERTIEAGDTIKLGEPANMPDGLRRGLTEFVESKPKIKNARLAWAEYEDGFQCYLLMLVTDTSKDEIMEGSEAVAALTDGPTITIMVIPVDQEDNGLTQAVEPFYIGLDL